nr:hybrid signal transduction histidine kinase M [Tanacetum cinerariifolium]
MGIFFDKLCQGYEVSKYIHGSSNDATTSTPTPLTLEKLKVDTIVLSWIFTTLSNTSKDGCRTSTIRQGSIGSHYRDCKRQHTGSRTIALKAKLRSIKLGDLSIDAYFRKIESIDTILTSHGSLVNSKDAVTLALEGCDNVCGIINHWEHFLNLKIARSMLTTQEMRLKSKSQSLPVDSFSSSPMVLMAESGTNRRPSNPQAITLLKAHVGLVTRGITTNDLLVKLLGQLENMGIIGSGSNTLAHSNVNGGTTVPLV